MKKMNKALAVAIAVAAFATTTNAQSTTGATKTGSATAVIIQPITLEEITPMHFGNISVTADPGTVILSETTADSRTSTGGVTLPLGAQAGAVKTAVFKVTGQGTNTYQITLPTQAVTLTRQNGTQTMSVSDFITNKNANAGALVDGVDHFNIGAILAVGGDQEPGEYVGSYDVSVDYN